MLDWIADNSESLQVLTALVTAVVWVFYLQLFLTNFVRQRRPHILISLGAGLGMKTRCFVTNLGFEPIYLSDVIVNLVTEDGENHRATITDRTELGAKELNDPAEATNQGPLASGNYIDIGDFGTLVERARNEGFQIDSGEGVEAIEITAIAVTASKGAFIAATRTYRVVRDGAVLHLVPLTLTARQLRSWWQRRHIRRELSARLAEDPKAQTRRSRSGKARPQEPRHRGQG